MKALVYSEYGPPEVLTVREIPTPVPGDNEVLVRNHATTVNFGYLGQQMGAYAEYIRVPENGCMTAMPDNLSFDEAAIVPYGSVMAQSKPSPRSVSRSLKPPPHTGLWREEGMPVRW